MSEHIREEPGESETDGGVPTERMGGRAGPGGGQADRARGPAEDDEDEVDVEERDAGGGDPGDAIAQLHAEFESLNDRHLRLAAEFENYRRRAQSELQESSARAQAALVGRLLDALDDLERFGRVDSEATSVEDLLEGIGLVARKLNRILEDAGVEMVDPEGEAFSPATMEAVMKVSADTAEEDDTVHEVFQRGCLFKGRLVRPARVSVRKHE